MNRHIYKLLSTSSLLLFAIIIGLSSCKSQRGIFKSRKNKKNKKEVVAQQASQEVTTEESYEAEEVSQPPVDSAPPKETRTYSKEEQLINYFEATANASTTTAANSTIREALTLFSSPEAVVLIVIYKGGSNPSYDAPTTIGKHLNYLKDTKNHNTEIDEVVYDTNGKIKELVLKK